MEINKDKMYHIGLTMADSAEAAIICGDPGRVEKIAKLMDNCRFITSNREYTSWEGTVLGKKVLVVSHGIGGPSTAICIEELAIIGVKTIIRVGTCGGMAEQVKSGDIVVASAAVRAEGTSKEYMPIEYPAAADYFVSAALYAAAKASGHDAHIGVVHCKDSFYGQHAPERMPVASELLGRWKASLQAGCLASEMETAALFTVSSVLGIRAGCALRVVWNQERVKKGIIDPEDTDSLSAAKVAVEAIKKLI